MGRPSAGIFRLLNAYVERATGADQLKSGMRAQLLLEQVQGIAQMALINAAGAVVISLVLMAASHGLPIFSSILAWSSALYGVLFITMRGRLRGRRSPQKAPLPEEVQAILLNSLYLGVIWGVLPVLVLPAGGPQLTTTVCIVIAGVFCATSFALLVLPQAALVFSVPLLLGLFVGIMGLEDPPERLTLTALLVVQALVMSVICFRHACSRVRHLTNESKIREQKDIISLLLKEFEENSSDWLWEFDRHGRFQRVSDRFTVAAAMPSEQLVGLHFHDFLRSVCRDDDPTLKELRQDIERRETFSGVELQVLVGGIERFWRLTGKPTHDECGAFAGYIGTASDITAEKNAERRINYLAHNDALTGLLNRTKFAEHLKQSAARLERYGSPFAVLYLDLDRFKAVNDDRGHLIGDKLLMQVSRRIRAELREADIAARLGGDEFAIVLNSNCDVREAGALARRLVESVGRPYELEDDIVSIGVSIGIAIAPADGTRPDQILRNADLALYRAKAEGRGTFRFFESQMDWDMRERRLLEFELRRALNEGEFVLHYQPLVSADDNRPSGFEALVRWNHPARGVISPAEFIPIAEQTGLIRQIGDWTIREACQAAARWPEELVVAVNLSAKHFRMSDVASVVRGALAASNLPPHRLELEITESLLIEHAEDVVDKLNELKALGVTIAMDDFGTGYSSLSSLLKFPFDKIKIDRSFVTASSDDMVARDVLRSIASLGRTLKIRITAEGVETQEQVDFLRDIACTQLQGFYFARPLDELDMARYFLAQFDLPLGELDLAAEHDTPIAAHRLAC